VGQLVLQGDFGERRVSPGDLLGDRGDRFLGGDQVFEAQLLVLAEICE
jgi:hypothetical protein